MRHCKYWTPECTEGETINGFKVLNGYCMSDEYGECPTTEQAIHYDDKDRLVETEEEILFNVTGKVRLRYL